MAKENHNALYVRKLSDKGHKKINKIADDLGVKKWLIIDNIIGHALGTKPIVKVDLSKYLKTK